MALALGVLVGLVLLAAALGVGMVIGHHLGSAAALERISREFAYRRAMRDAYGGRLHGACMRHGPVPMLWARCTCRRGVPPPAKPPAS